MAGVEILTLASLKLIHQDFEHVIVAPPVGTLPGAHYPSAFVGTHSSAST